MFRTQANELLFINSIYQSLDCIDDINDLNWWMLLFHYIFLRYAREIALLLEELPLKVGALDAI